MVKRRRSGSDDGFFKKHSLTLSLSAILLFWIVMYSRADPRTHVGAFFGNSIADWVGILMFVVATKYFFEVGSRESRVPHPRWHNRLLRFATMHSLTLVIIATGIGWVYLFARTDPNSKSGQVYGNIVSEWWQLLALIVMTKYFRESGSKEDG